MTAGVASASKSDPRSPPASSSRAGCKVTVAGPSAATARCSPASPSAHDERCPGSLLQVSQAGHRRRWQAQNDVPRRERDWPSLTGSGRPSRTQLPTSCADLSRHGSFSAGVQRPVHFLDCVRKQLLIEKAEWRPSSPVGAVEWVGHPSALGPFTSRRVTPDSASDRRTDHRTAQERRTRRAASASPGGVRNPCCTRSGQARGAAGREDPRDRPSRLAVVARTAATSRLRGSAGDFG
jgi:hypothetical protein